MLGESVTINARIQLINLKITRLDETATKEEVHDPVSKALGEGHMVDLDAVLYVRKTYGGMQTAVVRLKIQAAKKLLEKPTIRLNWSSCQIRDVMKPTKCLKCRQYDYITKNCTSEVDRSNSCIKCDAEGHKAESYTGQTCCIQCKDYVGKATNHVSGSRGCSVYEKAYKALLQKWR